jgi:ribose transport system substrate-binding protein
VITKKLTGIAVVAAAALLMAACSSSKAGSSQTDSPGGTSPSSSVNADVAAALAAAKANVEANTKFPSTIDVMDPLPTAPPTGKTVVFLQCEQESCHHQGDGIEAAAAAVGWTFKRLNFQAANPATLVSAMKTALQYKPVGVMFAGAPQATWSSMQDAYQKAGAFIKEDYDATPPSGPGVVEGFGYEKDSLKVGTLLADAQVTDANGAPAKSLLVSVPSYQVFVPLASAYKAEIAKTCPGCHVDTLDGTIPQIVGGQLVAAIVSAAKRIDGLKYIVSVNGQFVAQLPQALKAAGLEGKFKIISGKGGATVQQNVLHGDHLCAATNPLVSGGWKDMDVAIRTVMGLPIPEADHQVQVALLTKDNISTPRDSYDTPADYAEQFKKLWKVN